MADEDRLPVTVTVTPEPLPPEWSLSDTFSLARDLAVDHTAPMFKEILLRHDITEGHYATLQNNPIFKQMFLTMLKEWESVKNSPARLQLRALLGFEQGLPAMCARLSDDKEPLANVAQMAKVIADVAGASRPEQKQHAPGERITIQIDLGADTRLVFDKTPNQSEKIQPLLEGAAEIPPLLPVAEKQDRTPALPSVGEGNSS